MQNRNTLLAVVPVVLSLCVGRRRRGDTTAEVVIYVSKAAIELLHRDDVSCRYVRRRAIFRRNSGLRLRRFTSIATVCICFRAIVVVFYFLVCLDVPPFYEFDRHQYGDESCDAKSVHEIGDVVHHERAGIVVFAEMRRR